MEVIVEATIERNEFLTALNAAGLELNPQGAIRWGKDNPAHPRNWSPWLKAYSSAVILILEFVTYVSSARTVNKVMRLRC